MSGEPTKNPQTPKADAKPAQKKRRAEGRSPNYPAIDLETAIAKAQVVWDREKKAFSHVDTILGHLGYKPKSGAGQGVLAALIKFGLMVDEGSGPLRKAKLTEAALDILLGDRASPERAEAIRKAALLPPIHQRVWGLYSGTLPSDANLTRELLNMGFTSSGAMEFIRELRVTVEFANLAGSDETEQSGAPGGGESLPQRVPAPSTTAAFSASGSIKELPIPLSATDFATIRAPFPMTRAQWDMLKATLDAWERVWVVEPATAEQVPPPATKPDVTDAQR